MTITIKKLHLAIAVAIVALVAPATALATHVFDDVDDDRFYADPVEWAASNGITTGTSPTTFEPDRGVTRGESVTFLKRYDDNIVQPALTKLTDDTASNAADITGNSEAITGLEGRTSSHFVTGLGDGELLNTSYPGATVSRFDPGIYVVTFPGLEIFDFSGESPEVFCAVQTTTIGDGAPSGSRVGFNDDAGADTSQVIVSTFLIDATGTPADQSFFLTLTC